MADYSMVIGLETHIELSTNTKIFCSCTTKFGAEPNTHCCPVCVGLPGTLPRLNKSVVEYAVKAGLATNCEISTVSKMDRKNYVYPDLSKAYQISQFDYPLCKNGSIILSDGHIIRINRIHIEEDAGKLVHENDGIYIDYNRAGVPLIEIVTEPDFENPLQVREYLEKIRLIAKYLEISDCKMQEGSMRCDVNISVKQSDCDKLGTRTEIKNMNSINNIIKAITAEYKRQISCIESGNEIIQETLRYDETFDTTESMRSKEDSNDYRYFREPDLQYVYISEKEVDNIRDSLPDLPEQKKQRYISEYDLSENDANQIIKYPKIANYFEELVRLSGAPKLSTSVLLTHIFRYLPDDNTKEKAVLNISAKNLAYVISVVDSGEISGNFMKKIVDKMFESGKSFDELFDKSEFKEVDVSSVLSVVRKIIENNPGIVADYKGGKNKAIGALIGLVMKETKGRTDAKSVEKLLRENM